MHISHWTFPSLRHSSPPGRYPSRAPGSRRPHAWWPLERPDHPGHLPQPRRRPLRPFLCGDEV